MSKKDDDDDDDDDGDDKKVILEWSLDQDAGNARHFGTALCFKFFTFRQFTFDW